MDKENRNAMKQFIAKFTDRVEGVLSGWDRLVLRGELRALYIPGEGGMQQYLKSSKVLLKDYGKHVTSISRRLKEASLAAALELGRVVQYLAPSVDKAAVARRIAIEQNIRSGLVCVLSSVEPCQSFRTVPNGKTQRLELKLERRQCMHLYHYWMDPVFGFMNARIQTWFPFRIQVCVNGREWLARQMDAVGIGYLQQGNSFPWIEDFERAQKLMDQQGRQNWLKTLSAIAQRLNPIHAEIFRHYHVNYYWTTHESEWAADFRFRRQQDLKRLYPLLLQHGITIFGSTDVMRFLGKRVAADNHLPPGYEGELFTNIQQRAEGVRIKHYIDGNSLKAYDKAYTSKGSLLRAEVTLNRIDTLRVYRRKQGDRKGPKSWRPMRRSVADLNQRKQFSQQAVGRYLNAWASVDDRTRLHELVESLEQPTRWKKQPVRGLRVWGQDRALLEAISRGEFNLNGFRNRDLQPHFYGPPCLLPEESRRRSAAMGRKLRMLRAHGLIQKLPHTHRYQLTATGRLAITAILAARQVTVAELTHAA
jgi:hypothetical protein